MRPNPPSNGYVGRPCAAGRLSRGFTLIEMMVGLAMGLLVTLVIAEVLMVTEARRRATSSGADAQVNGALAMYTLQRDVQSAGYGVSSNASAVGCTIKARFGGANFTWAMVPVRIVDGGVGGAPDTIQVISSSKSSYSAPITLAEDHPQTADTFVVNSTLGVASGDLIVAVPKQIDVDNWCGIFNVSTTVGAGTNKVFHTSGGETGAWNAPAESTVFPVSGLAAGSYLVNLGQLSDRTYSINNNALQLTTFDTSTATSSSVAAFPQIVNLQALYGKDTDADGVVDTYDAVTPTTNAGWLQVLSVRVAMVARSGEYDKDEVTTTQPLWDVGTADTVASAAACGTSKCLALSIDSLPDWKHYRYKVYDTVIPMRNMLWRS